MKVLNPKQVLNICVTSSLVAASIEHCLLTGKTEYYRKTCDVIDLIIDGEAGLLREQVKNCLANIVEGNPFQTKTEEVGILSDLGTSLV